MTRCTGRGAAGRVAQLGLALGFALALLAACAPPEPSSPVSVRSQIAALKRPNVVLLLCDTLRADWTTPYGSRHDTAPNLAKWASHGVLFEQVRAQSSWTKMSVASIMTSLWPRSHGIRQSQDGLGEAAVTLAETFQDAGYATYAVQTNGWLDQSFGFHQGFERYMFPRGKGAKRTVASSVWPHADHVYDEAVRLIDGLPENQPFFLYLHFMDVHEYASPPEFRTFGKDPAGYYLAAIRWVDDALARIRQKLADSGQLENTVIVFGSDHGEAFGENGKYGHARNVLTPVLWVPLVIRFPFETRPIRVSQQVRNLDIAPTLLDIAGIDIPESFEGRSLLPLLDAEPSEPSRAAFAALGQPLFRDASVQDSISNSQWTYARNRELDDDEFLFDRKLDPTENVNLLLHEPDASVRMRALLMQHLDVGPKEGVLEKDIRIDPGIAQRLRALGYLK